MRGYIQLKLTTGDTVNGIAADLTDNDTAQLRELFDSLSELKSLHLIPFTRETQERADRDEMDDNDAVYFNPQHIVSARLVLV